MRKIIITCLFLVGFLYACTTQQPPSDLRKNVPDQIQDDLSVCIQQQQDAYKNARFVPGEILVGFLNTPENQQIEILNSFDVDYEGPDPNVRSSSLYKVNVEEGSEFEWICRIKTNPEVSSAEPHIVVSAT